MTATMLPPPEDASATPTEPPERSRESTMPPADLGPTGLALRLLALEAKVSDIHAETFGISKAYHDICDSLVGIEDSLARLSRVYEVLVNERLELHQAARATRSELDELEARVTLSERKPQ